MRQPTPLRGQMSVAPRTDAAERVGAFLRSKYPTKTAENVAADTGLGIDGIQKALDRGSVPSGLAIAAMILAYGPDFLAALLGERTPAWLTAAGQDAEIARLQAQREALDARLATLRNR